MSGKLLRMPSHPNRNVFGQETVENIARLERLLIDHHAEHSSRFGPIDECKEPSCRDAKVAIMWLRHRQKAPAALHSHRCGCNHTKRFQRSGSPR